MIFYRLSAFVLPTNVVRALKAAFVLALVLCVVMCFLLFDS